MSKFQLDFSKFKKVSSTPHTTTLQHPAGHQITLAHKSIPAKTMAQLKDLPSLGAKAAPKHLADGGDTDQETLGQKIGYPGSGKPKMMAEGGEAMNPKLQQSNLGADLKENYANPKKKKDQDKPRFANGAAPVEADSATDSSDQTASDDQAQAPAPDAAAAQQQDPAATPQQAVPPATAVPTTPDVDPSLQRKRQIYNNAVQAALGVTQSPYNMAKGDGAPDNEQVAKMSFGANGEPPQNFNADLWNNKVLPQFKIEQAQQAAASTATAQKQALESSAKADAGISIPQPTRAPQAAPGSAQPPADATPAAQPGDAELAQLNGQGSDIPTGSNYGVGTGAAPLQDQPANRKPTDPQQLYQNAKQLGYQSIMNERGAFQTDLENEHITPETLSSLFGKKDTLGKMGTLAGLLLGGMGSGVLHQQNPVLQAMQSQIDNDLKAQQLNLGKSESLLSNNMQLFNNLPDALKFSKINMMDAQLHHLVKLAARYPQNANIQQQLASARMVGEQSSTNLMDNIATNQAYMHMMQGAPESAAQVAAMNGDSKMANMIANRVVSTQGGSANILPYLDNEARQATVLASDGKYYNTGSAANAKEYTEAITAYKPIMSDLNELDQLNTIGSRLSPAQRARAESLKGSLTVGLNDLAKSHRISESDIGFEKGRFTDPTAFSTLLSGNSATKQLKASLTKKIQAVNQQFIPNYRPVQSTPR
jgi:hypothetical protein